MAPSGRLLRVLNPGGVVGILSSSSCAPAVLMAPSRCHTRRSSFSAGGAAGEGNSHTPLQLRFSMNTIPHTQAPLTSSTTPHTHTPLTITTTSYPILENAHTLSPPNLLRYSWRFPASSAFFVETRKKAFSTSSPPSGTRKEENAHGKVHGDASSTHTQEFGSHTHTPKTVGLYNIPVEDHGSHEEGGHHHDGDGGGDDHHSPRGHLFEDGTPRWKFGSDNFHWYDIYSGTPKQQIVEGKNLKGETVKMIKGVETRPMDELFSVSQYNVPFWPRTRLNYWGNNDLGLKAEFLFFWIPTMIIASLAIPCLTMVYMADEAIYTTMTVKVVGRQWYWLYEVESPPEAEEE